MKKLILNCPNCGAPLRHDGYCEYCNTKVRYENELDITKLAGQSCMEILLKITDDNGTCYIPLEGSITNIKVETSNEDELYYYDDAKFVIASEPMYTIVFEGRISKERLSAGALQ